MKSRLGVLAAFLAAGALTIASAAGAQEQLKIGYVSSERILRDSPQARAARQKVESEFSKRNRDVIDQGARWKNALERFEKDAPVMTETDRNRRERELAEMERDLQRRQRELREDFNQRLSEEMISLSERAKRIVVQIAEQEKYDVILQDAVHVGPRVDITDKVLRALANGK